MKSTDITKIKKPWHAPVLHVYGNIRSLTHTIGTGGVTDATGGGQNTKNKSM